MGEGDKDSTDSGEEYLHGNHESTLYRPEIQLEYVMYQWGGKRENIT